MASTFLHAYFRAFQTEFTSFLIILSVPLMRSTDPMIVCRRTAPHRMLKLHKMIIAIVTVDNRACVSTAIFKLKVMYIITSWSLAHPLRNTLCARAGLYNV